ncbi:hypothetical protein VUR80DRAFT_2726 [Thermomyces stellatus]
MVALKRYIVGKFADLFLRPWEYKDYLVGTLNVTATGVRLVKEGRRHTAPIFGAARRWQHAACAREPPSAAKSRSVPATFAHST